MLSKKIQSKIRQLKSRIHKSVARYFIIFILPHIADEILEELYKMVSDGFGEKKNN